MSLHKLSAGDGYTYLTRQVAVADSTQRGYSSLGDYYAAKGEAPGVWVGAQADQMGLTGTTVTEQQMKNLFGAGLHPNAQQLEDDALAALPGSGARRDQQRAVEAAGKLGRKFPVFAATPAWQENLAAAYRLHNLNHDLPAGDRVPDEAKQRIRTAVASSMFIAEYGREPRHDHELSGFIAQQSRPASSAVAGYDLTFSPVKSVSTLWAIAPRDVAEKLEAAHQAAVHGTLLWLEKEAGYTREGTGSVSQIRINGFLATSFTHRDSRAGDPDLHTHVAVSNKVQTPDGRWLALDARMLYRYDVPASEHYNMLLEAEVTRRVGGRFAPRETVEDGKRDIRELVGVPPALNQHFSSRRVMIEAHRAQLVGKFRADHGRVPTTLERIQLSQQANLATRQAKHQPMSLAEQRVLWQAYPDAICSDTPEQILADVTGQTPQYADVTPTLLADLTSKVVQVVAASRAQWRENNLSAEARRQVKAAGIHPDQMPALAEQVTAAATGQDFCVPIGMDTDINQPLPDALRDVDGKVVFRVAKGQWYTSPEILDAETRIVAAAGQTGAWAMTDADVDIAHLEFSANHQGRTLNTGQEAMVRQVATSGRRVQLVFGPAGTGKTTSLAVLARAAQSRGYTVIGLAPQASAAKELGAAIPGITSDTLHKLTFDITAVPAGEREPWVTAIDSRTLVIIDEAGLAGTRELDVAIGHITGLGGRVLLVGDDRQRAANGAGGVLRDIESAHGALMLDEVMRFQDRGVPGAGALHGRATLALRQGDPAAVGYYADRGLITAVTPDTVAEQVFTGWAVDIAAGADSIMIAPTLDLVADLNSRARAARIAAAGEQPGPDRPLPRGERVSAGDVIVTKKNKRVLSLGGTDFVRNNYRWTVDAINVDGSITATELTRGVTRTLPAWYVDKGWVRLGYAHTEASVQGMTVGSRHQVGTAHVVFTDTTNRNQAYTSLSRATDRTQLYGIVLGSGDPHDVTTPTALEPQTAIEMFTAVLGRDGSDRSATTTLREAADPALRLGAPGNAALAYRHAIVTGCQDLIGPERMKLISDTAQVLIPGIVDAPAWETLQGHLATIAAHGDDPIRRLAAAARGRQLDTATDVAAVLDFRLDRTGNHSLGAGPLPYLPAIPAALAAQPSWNTYLPARADLVSDLAQQVRDRAFGWTTDDAPAWAIPYLPDLDLVADLAVWRAAHAVPDTDLRPAGPRPLHLASRIWHTQFTDRAVAVAGDPTRGVDRWQQLLLERHHLDVAEDDWFPVLAARLTLADRAGLDIRALLAAAINDQQTLPAQVPAKALWWRLEPHLGALTADHVVPPTGHRLRPAWVEQLTQGIGELDTERVMSDRLWPAIVAHVDRAARGGHPTESFLPAAAAMFTSARPTVGAHEMATVLLWQLSTVTNPTPPDFELEAAYPDPAEQDLQAPDGAHHILDAVDARRADEIEPGLDPDMVPEPEIDPFDVDRHTAAAAQVGIAHADTPDPAEPDGDEIPGLPADPVDEAAPADLHTALSEPARHWVTPEPPTDAPVNLDPEVAPVMLRTSEQQAALHRARAAIVAAQQFWAEQTPGSWVPDYITSRGLDPADFLYAPAGWTRTRNHLMRQGFTQDELKAAGLITLSVRGSYVDLFSGRAVTGIHDPDTGNVVAFTGRKNPDNSNERAPKYVNSPTTDLFTKSTLPFGLTPANIAALRDGADLAVVEGPMDALAVNQAFHPDRSVVAVAASGVAFTADHIATINQVAPNPDRRWLLVLDDDQAGQAAAVKIFPRLAAAGITHPETVVGLAGKDPAEMLQSQGKRALRDAFDGRRPLAELVIDTLIAKTDLTNGWVESRWRAMSDVAPFIAALPHDQIIDQTLRAADIIGWDTDRAIDQVTRHLPETHNPPHKPAIPGDLGLPERPKLSTTRPVPATEPPAGGNGDHRADQGTVLTRPPIDTDPSPKEQAEPLLDLTDLDPADLQPEAATTITATPTVDVDPGPDDLTDQFLLDPAAAVIPAEEEIGTVVELVDHARTAAATYEQDFAVAALRTLQQQQTTEQDAALAWLEATDAPRLARYLQVQTTAGEQEKRAAAAQLLTQYRKHRATETVDIAAQPGSIDVVDQPAADLATEGAKGTQAGSVQATRPYQDLPDQVLAEQAGQLAAEYADAERVAINAAANLTALQIQVEQDHGPEVMRLQARHLANEQRLDAMQQALQAAGAADNAQSSTAAAGVKVMEAEQELTEARGNRRRVEAQHRLDQATAAYDRQRDWMLQLDAHSTELASQLGTETQQREALSLQQPDYQRQLVDQLEQARRDDREAVEDSKAWVTNSTRHQLNVADELTQINAEQTWRALHPDPRAELQRQETYEDLQQQESDEVGWDYAATWDRDLDLPSTPDTSIDR